MASSAKWEWARWSRWPTPAELPAAAADAAHDARAEALASALELQQLGVRPPTRGRSRHGSDFPRAVWLFDMRRGYGVGLLFM